MTPRSGPTPWRPLVVRVGPVAAALVWLALLLAPTPARAQADPTPPSPPNFPEAPPAGATTTVAPAATATTVPKATAAKATLPGPARPTAPAPPPTTVSPPPGPTEPAPSTPAGPESIGPVRLPEFNSPVDVPGSLLVGLGATAVLAAGAILARRLRSLTRLRSR